MGLEAAERRFGHVKGVRVALEEPAHSSPQNRQAIPTEQLLQEIQIEHWEPAGGLDHFSKPPRQRRPPEALDQRALRPRRGQDSPAPFHAPRSQKGLLLYGGRMSQEADRAPGQLEHALSTTRVDRAVPPRRMRCAQQLERRVVREDGIGPNGLGDQERVCLERPRFGPGRNDGIDSPCHPFQTPSAEMVFQSMDSPQASRRWPQGARRFVEREHRVDCEKLLGLHFAMTT